jgi:type III restriction enzyme
MKLKLEQLEYQQQAIQSVVSVFKGQERNTFDNACIEGIRSNLLSLTEDEIIQNIKDVLLENEISKETANIEKTNDLCIKMETGTGKTPVYIKTIFELFEHYGFTKFLIITDFGELVFQHLKKQKLYPIRFLCNIPRNMHSAF